MPTKQQRINIAPSPEFRKFLDSYAKENNLKSMSEALVKLAEISAREAGFQGETMLGRGKYRRD